MSADNYAKVIEAALTEHVRFGPVGCSIDAFEWYRVVHPEALRALLEERKAMQAKIDALMLEFCPGEMTAEQVENWASHQKAALTTTADSLALAGNFQSAPSSMPVKQRLALIQTISDMMTFGGATLTEKQENVLYACLRQLDEAGMLRPHPEPESEPGVSPS